MTLTISLGSKRVLADATLKWSLPAVGAHVPHEAAFIRACVATHTTLQLGSASVGALMHCR